MKQAKIKFAYSDYLLLPEERRCELIGGDFFMVPSPGFAHQSIVMNLAVILRDHVRRNNLGVVLVAPFDVVLSEEDVVQPDVLYISNERRSILTEKNAQGAPDLVVEVLSPGTAERDRELKRKLYARFGVREYWIVDPQNQSIQVLGPGRRGLESRSVLTEGVMRSNLLPGLEMSLAGIFEKL